MMAQKLCLFYAGYACRMPSLYFDSVRLVNDCRDSGEQEFDKCLSEFEKELEHDSYEPFTQLRTAVSIAKYFNLQVQPIPQDEKTYFIWMPHYIGKMEDRFPMNQIAYYYFYYARRISELICTLGVSRVSLHLMAESCFIRPDLTERTQKNLEDAEYILFRLIASSALLSSEYGHRYFNVFYQDLNRRFALFRNLDISKMKTADMKATVQNMDDYMTNARKGIQKCICTLRDLSY
jgi:hypothetical protein